MHPSGTGGASHPSGTGGTIRPNGTGGSHRCFPLGRTAERARRKPQAAELAAHPLIAARAIDSGRPPNEAR